MDNQQESCNDRKYKKQGLCSNYIDAWGNPKTVDESNLTLLLDALTKDSDTNQSSPLSPSIENDIKLAPVYVWQQHKQREFSLDLSAYLCSSSSSDSLSIADQLKNITWQLKGQLSTIRQGNLLALLAPEERAQILDNKSLEAGSIDISNLHLSLSTLNLTLGYYDFQISINPAEPSSFLKKFTTRLIIAPEKCYQSPTQDKLWGTSIQLYTLRSQQNWGVGDFSDLKVLASYLASVGADYIALNPLHALFAERPEDASPYSPSSRYWLNFIYLDVTNVDGFNQSVQAQAFVASSEFQQKLSQVRGQKNVDYTNVMQLKLDTLRLIYNDFKLLKREKSASMSLFKDYKEQQGNQLFLHACFEALHDAQAIYDIDFDINDWALFNQRYSSTDLFSNNGRLRRKSDSSDDSETKECPLSFFIQNNTDLIDFYCFLQWQTHKQLHEVHIHTLQLGMKIGLFRDLAVGVNAQSSDVWCDPSIFSTQASIGAPPDVLNYQGQNWGLPPMKPNALKTTKYDAFIRLLRTNMQSCGALRIDHILGLLRLWWIPSHLDASNGAYVEYPIDDLIDILALESHHNQCVIVGEDLGTIPTEIIQKLADANILSYKVFFFHTAPDGGYYSPHDYPAQSLATLCTHDMPTLKGYWQSLDIKLGETLGLHVDDQQAQQLYQERLHAKERILDSMRWHNSLPEDINNLPLENMPLELPLNRALQLHMAQANSHLLSLQLEDWLEMEDAVNVPGTSTEYPNWRRKLNQDLEDMVQNTELSDFLIRLTQIRNS